MTPTVEQLVAVVAEEAEHCERLLGLMKRQQEHLVSGDTGAIEINVREQEMALRRSHDLERRRQRLVDAIAQEQGMGGEKPDLARIIATVSNDYGRRLTELRTSMKKSIERLSKTKEQNRMLIEQSLGNINEFIRLIAAANGPSPEYTPGHRVAATSMPLSVNRVG
ncbi:MAG: flagellar protein FlgN [Candidatus Zixiibacteriota bacterium]